MDAADAGSVTAEAGRDDVEPLAGEPAASEAAVGGRGRGGRGRGRGVGSRGGRAGTGRGAAASKRKRAGEPAEEPAPPRPRNAFAFFAESRSQELIAESPELETRTIERERVLVAEWRVLPDEERAPFEQEAANDRERYDAAVAAHRAAKQAAAEAAEAAEAPRQKHSRDAPAASEPAAAQVAPEPRPVRQPASAFVFFSQEQRPFFEAAQPELQGSPIQLERLLVRAWRGLPEARRKVFEKRAARDMERYESDLAGGAPMADEDPDAQLSSD